MQKLSGMSKVGLVLSTILHKNNFYAYLNQFQTEVFSKQLNTYIYVTIVVFLQLSTFYVKAAVSNGAVST